MCPYLERSCFSHSRYDKAEVVNDGLLVRVQYAAMLYFVVTPRGKKFGMNMVVIIVCHFSGKGQLACCDIFLFFGFIETFLPHCLICNLLFFHISHLDAYYA